LVDKGVNAERLWPTLEQASTVGRWRPPGVQRLALSDPYRAIRDTFRNWCDESVLAVRGDHPEINECGGGMALVVPDYAEPG